MRVKIDRELINKQIVSLLVFVHLRTIESIHLCQVNLSQQFRPRIVHRWNQI